MGGLKGSKITLVRKEDCIPFSIYFKGLKGSKLALVRQKVLFFNIYEFLLFIKVHDLFIVFVFFFAKIFYF